MILKEFVNYLDNEPIDKDISAASVFATYNQEQLETIPYLIAIGDNEVGKSTFTSLLGHLCYRPLLGVSIPAADIYGFLGQGENGGCIIEDEAQGIEQNPDKLKIWKSGYKKGAVVPRTTFNKDGIRIINYYNVFAFKAAASEKLPRDKGLLQRFEIIQMSQGYPPMEWDDDPEERDRRLDELRNILLKKRMINKQRQDKLHEKEVHYVELRGRVKEHYKPLLQVTYGLPVYDRLLQHINSVRQQRIDELQESFDGHLVRAVKESLDQNKGNELSFEQIWEELKEITGASIDPRDNRSLLTDHFGRVTKYRVGHRLREIFATRKHISKTNDRRSIQIYQFDLTKVERIAEKYGYTSSKSSESSKQHTLGEYPPEVKSEAGAMPEGTKTSPIQPLDTIDSLDKKSPILEGGDVMLPDSSRGSSTPPITEHSEPPTIPATRRRGPLVLPILPPTQPSEQPARDPPRQSTTPPSVKRRERLVDRLVPIVPPGFVSEKAVDK
jgi:hypothetical protein